jgi:hypothetical protein
VSVFHVHTLRVRALALAASLMLLVPFSRPLTATTPPVSDVKVRAAFLINIAKFVQWPAASGPLVIGVAGDPALATAVSQAVSGRTIEGRAVTVRVVEDGERPDGINLLYVGSANQRENAALLARVQGPVLTVGATVRFMRDGGIIRVFVEADRMRFQINHRRAVESGLQISSQLLSLAAQ